MSSKRPSLALLLILTLAGPVSPLVAEEEKPETTVAEKAEKLWGANPREVVTLNLKECLARALQLNRELEVASYDIKTAEEKLREVRKIGYPILEYEYNVAPVPKDVSNAVESFFSGDLTVFNKVKLGLGIPLQTFGKVKTGKQLATLGVRSEEEKRVKKQSEIAVRVHELYNGILLSHEIRRLLNAAREELAKEIQKREESEGGNPTELLKLKLFHADLERRIEEGDKRAIMAKEALRILINLDPRVHLEIASTRLRPVEKEFDPFEKHREEALQNRSDLKLLDIALEAREKQLTLEKRLPAPNLGVGALFEMGRAPGITGITTTDDFSDPLNFTRAGVGLRLTGQFDFHGTRSKIRQAKSELMKTTIQRSLAREAATLDVKETYLDARNAKEEIERAEEANKLSRQLLFLTQSNYDIGLAESRELVDALQSFLETRGKYFEAVFRYNVTVAKLEQKEGRIPQ